MARLRFGTGTTVRDFAAYRSWLELAESIGFELLTCGDSQSLWADCFALMTFAAERTRRPDLAITVSNPCTRHPAVAASACAAVQQLAQGRFRFGLASGDSALRNIGVRPASVAEIESYALAVRALAAGGSFDWQGSALALHWLPRPAPVPIWIAAEGPRTQRMAGRIADGVVLSNCLTPERRAAALENLGAGAAEAGRHIEDLEIWDMCNLVFAPSESEGIDRIRSVLAGTANHVFRFTLEGKALPPELVPRVKGLMGEYQSRFHAQPGARNPNEDLIDKYGLRDWLARQGTIAGPPERCVERLHEVAGYGVRNLIVSQFISDQAEWMRTFGAKVLPAFS
jgi:alkanesulfonate monooxygenase SsuD/methylene tetrahydromethanopterin reductase-like flavin-dependent oxidoreductase (luciferase family)